LWRQRLQQWKLHLHPLLLTLPLLPPTQRLPQPLLAPSKLLPVPLLTLLPLALPMLPKPLLTLLLKPPKLLRSLHSNWCIRALCPSTKKPPLGGFFASGALSRQPVAGAVFREARYFRSLASNCKMFWALAEVSGWP